MPSGKSPTAARNTRSPSATREWKMQLQRKQLIDIGIDMFCRKGYEGTSVAEIANRAGVTEQTFYRYFKSKDELAFDWNDENGRRALAFIAECPKTEKPLVSMKKALRSLIDVIDADKPTWQKMVRLIYSSPALEARVAFVGVQWSKALAAELKRGRHLDARTNLQIDAAVSAAMGAFNVATHAWAHADGSDSVGLWVADAFAVI